MNAKELHDKPLSELKEEETRLRRELFDNKFKHGTRQLLDTTALQRGRRDLARVLTVMTQKQNAQTGEAAK
jgi:large subunit ribosomal protein L29